jgi:hypothetical protein
MAMDDCQMSIANVKSLQVKDKQNPIQKKDAPGSLRRSRSPIVNRKSPFATPSSLSFRGYFREVVGPRFLPLHSGPELQLKYTHARRFSI